MKFLYILTSFTLVNVLVALDELTKQVIMTNNQMWSARENLPDVIQYLILIDKFPMVELAIILAIPEANVETEDKFLTDYIVQEKIKFQKIAQERIKWLTKFEATQIDEDLYKDANLNGLGIERRGTTLKAIKKLIRDVISGDNKNFSDLSDMCILIGTFRSIRDSPEYVHHVGADKKSFCILDVVQTIPDVPAKVYKYYTDEEGTIWDDDQKGNSRQSLSKQVKELQLF